MSTTVGSKYSIGDLVWAKMKGFSPWPGRVTDPTKPTLKRPPSNLKQKPAYWIYFFGSNDFGWVAEDQVKPYLEHKEQFAKQSKSQSFKEALEKIEEYIKNGTIDELKQLEEQNSSSSATEANDAKTSVSSVKDDKTSAANTSSAPTTPSSTGQRDYSRTPFKSKTKKSATVDTNADDQQQPPAKKVKSTLSSDVDSSSSATTTTATAAATSNSNSNTTNNTNSTGNSTSKSPTTTKVGGARNLLARTSAYLSDPDMNNQSGELDLMHVSAKAKSIRASTLRFGFIGLGLMGRRLVKNLLNSGHQVTIWNRTPSKCKDFVKVGASKATTPADVILASDITFSCLSDPQAVKEIVFGNCGVLAEIKEGKGYVEMTTIDSDTSNDVSEAIIARGGRYLEASIISNGKQQAEEGDLTVILAGDDTLFKEINTCLEAIASHAFFLGSNVGDASKMGLVVSMMSGNLIGALAESMALADRTGISQKDLLEIFSFSPLCCPALLSKGKAMVEGGFPTEMPLTHMQKDLRLAMRLAEDFEHPLPITAATNEVFKHAKHLGYSDHDVAAVYIRSRFY